MIPAPQERKQIDDVVDLNDMVLALKRYKKGLLSEKETLMDILKLAEPMIRASSTTSAEQVLERLKIYCEGLLKDTNRNSWSSQAKRRTLRKVLYKMKELRAEARER